MDHRTILRRKEWPAITKIRSRLEGDVGFHERRIGTVATAVSIAGRDVDPVLGVVGQIGQVVPEFLVVSLGCIDLGDCGITKRYRLFLVTNVGIYGAIISQLFLDLGINSNIPVSGQQ